MDQTSASVECQTCNQTNKDELFTCTICEESYWCKAHWMEWDPHKPSYKNSSKHQQTPVSQTEWLEKMDQQIFDQPDANEYSQQHKRNLSSFWFGINYKDATAHMNHNVYGEIILSSHFADKSKQYPSLVSFVGATGAGKSTLIKAIINYGCHVENRTEIPTNSSWDRIAVPIAGLKAVTMPTSSDVHLYHDPATINTDRPLLFADSEGLTGGNQNPVGSLLEQLGNLLHKYSRKILPSSEPSSKVTRSYCVEHIYPRILYAFSDVICYVVQQDPRIMESLITRMIMWADNARHASLNQVTLPRVILVINRVSMSDQERKDWENAVQATARVIADLEKSKNLGDELRTIADRWNSILEEREKIHSVMDLFLRYFDSIFIVNIPPRGRSQDTPEFYGQVQQLRQHILRLSKEVGAERSRNVSQMDSGLLESLFNMGFEHFIENLDKPFDFFKFAMASRPRPKDIDGNATYLMTRMRETETNYKQFDRRCVELFSSYRTMNILSQTTPGRSSRAEETIFTEPFGRAYRDFYAKSRCWFEINGRQCQSTREGHTRGYLDRYGELIASGDYKTPYKDESCDTFIRQIVQRSNMSISQLMNGSEVVFGPSSPVVQSHLGTLRNEREFWKSTFSCRTCFSCLVEAPDFTLRCSHMICRSCVKLFGRQLRQEFTYDLDSCPLCSEGTQREEMEGPLAHIQLKPDNAGVRVLSIDGGGVRGVISARILQMLEEKIGLGLPIFHFFDLIIGTSSGGIISLALGANLWSAEKCVNNFKNLARGSFKKRLATSLPVVGWISSLLVSSYYEESAIQSALEATFSAPGRRPRYLVDEPYADHHPTSSSQNPTFSMRDIKLGVTAVNVMTSKTTLMTNYNRKTSKEDDRGPLIYRQDGRETELFLWEAARCTSAAPFMFPVYRAKDGHAYQDGGMNENNPIGIAVKEAQSLWPQNPRVDVALSIGTGWADNRIAEYRRLHADIVHGWLKRCIDSFESKLDSERLWQEYYQTINNEERARHHRLNVKLPGTLPFMGDTGALQNMDDETTTFFKDDDGLRQLQKAAEALLASLFYVSIERPNIMPDNERYLFKGRILCRLEQEHQLVLLSRLKKSNCGFRVHEGTVNIDFAAQKSRLRRQEPFEQFIQWSGYVRNTFHIRLVFRSDVSAGVPESGIAPAVQYEIGGSPYKTSLT